MVTVRLPAGGIKTDPSPLLLKLLSPDIGALVVLITVYVQLSEAGAVLPTLTLIVHPPTSGLVDIITVPLR